mmetsp:Transcript_9247/g.30212  ORF Transcript_9247/g.30212 Transcript_9247/m.30212 type:complete len:85 (-) Transcript_9247:229-483(-)
MPAIRGAVLAAFWDGAAGLAAPGRGRRDAQSRAAVALSDQEAEEILLRRRGGRGRVGRRRVARGRAERVRGADARERRQRRVRP